MSNLLEIQTKRIEEFGSVYTIKFGPDLLQLKVSCPESIMATTTSGGSLYFLTYCADIWFQWVLAMNWYHLLAICLIKMWYILILYPHEIPEPSNNADLHVLAIPTDPPFGCPDSSSDVTRSNSRTPLRTRSVPTQSLLSGLDQRDCYVRSYNWTQLRLRSNMH